MIGSSSGTCLVCSKAFLVYSGARYREYPGACGSLSIHIRISPLEITALPYSPSLLRPLLKLTYLAVFQEPHLKRLFSVARSTWHLTMLLTQLWVAVVLADDSAMTRMTKCTFPVFKRAVLIFSRNCLSPC